MKTIDETVRDLKDLPDSDVRMVHNIIISLKRAKQTGRARRAPRHAYRKAQRAFASYKGSLSDDIVASREDRT